MWSESVPSDPRSSGGGPVFGAGMAPQPPAPPERPIAIPPSGVLELATSYGVPSQLLEYIENFGVAFIHGQTGT